MLLVIFIMLPIVNRHIEGSCRLTITGSKAFKVNMYASAARASSGLGYRANESGIPSVYTQVEIWKEA